jgi:septal ring factor EnvC (AmiA/AmiB activator)
MLSKEALILLFLVLLFLCLVSWTTIEKETFFSVNATPTPSNNPLVLNVNAIDALNEIEKDIKNKRVSQDDQEQRLDVIEKMINDLEIKMNNIKDNDVIKPVNNGVLNRDCSYDDPYCLVNNNYHQVRSVNHWATKLS